MHLSTGDRLGPYEILAAIGAGGMGEVYRARDTRLGRDVAIKVSAAQFSERFEREARAVAALNHPNICTLYDVGPNYLVMEYVEGVEPKGPLPLDKALGYAKQIANALDAAHEKGIVHRDLKPANVKIKPEGTVKVLDFGLAKVAEPRPEERATDPSTLTIGATQMGMILGTAAYMSPEQARGESVDKRADIWAFGVVLYEMLTGQRLFEGKTVSDTLAAVLIREPDLSAVDAKARRLLRRCLEKDSAKRLRGIGDAMELVEDGLPTFSPRKSQQSWLAWSMAAATMLIAAALAFEHFRETLPQQQTARFEIAAPEKSTLYNFELSPDGRYMAMVAGQAGKIQLWVRPIDTLEARVLPDTENATLPFWSPDSAYIGFATADGKLKKIAMSGGPAQTLCNAFTFRGGTWNRDGVIVFSSDGSLRRVAAGGGPPTLLMKSNGAENYRSPEFLPGGRNFLYTATGGTKEADGVYVGSLDGKTPVHLLADLTNAFYMPLDRGGMGYLLFKREDTLMAQLFDPSRLRFSGDVFPVAEQVGDAGTGYRAAASVSGNGTLAYGPGVFGEGRQLVWVNRGGRSLGTVGRPGAINFEALSRDEKRGAFGLVDVSGNSDIWVYEFARGSTTRFSFGPVYNGEPTWSPDGTRIIFKSSAQVGGTFGDIYQKLTGGAGKEELILRVGHNLRIQDWSRNGKLLVYVPDISDPKTSADIWLLPLEAERKPVPYLATKFRETNGQLSPDGKWMAYRSDESGQDQVYVQPVPATGAKFQISTTGGGRPRWRRDGKELFYTSADGKLMAVSVKLGATIEAGIAQPLFDFPVPLPFGPHQFYYQPTADGQRFLMNAPATEGSSAPISVVLNWTAGLKK